MSNARYIQNRYARINQLPPEILALIFEFLAVPLDEFTIDQSLLDRVHIPLATHVCQDWRRIAHSTPALWTVFRMDRGTVPPPDQVMHFLSLSLSRSGVLPLSIYINAPTHEIELPLIAELTAHISRIGDLRLRDVSPEFLRSLNSHASQLKALHIEHTTPSRGRASPSTLFNEWQTPQLRAISVLGYTVWRTATFGHLRYLAIAAQYFDPANTRALLHVLSCNPHIEDLFLCDVYSDIGDMENFLLVRQRVAMHSLNRLYIRSSFDEGALDLNIPALLNATLDIDASRACCKYYSVFDGFMGHIDVAEAFPPHALCVSKTLVITPTVIMGTDGQSAFAVNHSSRSPIGDFLQHCVDVSNVQELRIFHNDVFEFAENMRQVTTLILATKTHLKLWLPKILEAHLFPALEHLCLMTRETYEGQTIFQFLKDRKRAGRPIGTLRFVKDAAHDHSRQTFDSWRRHHYKFARHVDRVVFDDSPDWPYMDLPSACFADTPLTGYWSPHIWRPGP